MSQNRHYLSSHPWISFRVDLKIAPPKLWILLGEAQALCEQIAQTPLLPATANHMHQLYLAKGVGGTTAIEGNTLTEEEVLQHLEGSLKLPPSREYLAKELDNIVAACNQMLGALGDGESEEVSLSAILEFNRLVLDGLEHDTEVNPGEIRTQSVVVGRYRGAPAKDCEYLLNRMCEWLSGPDFEYREGRTLVTAILKAIVAHLYLVWIHPFDDGNGRTARLIEFQILINAGVPSPAAHLLSNHYNLTRREYYQRLDRASRSQEGLVEFIEYGVRGFVEGLQGQIDLIRSQVLNVSWRDYVHDVFRGKEREVDRRRRHLLLDLSQAESAISLAEVREVSPRVAALYSGMSDQTLERDLNVLIEMKLAEKTKSGFRARKESILSFLPFRANENH